MLSSCPRGPAAYVARWLVLRSHDARWGLGEGCTALTVAIEQLAHFPRERLAGEGLLEDSGPGGQPVVVDHRVFGIARYVEHGDARPPRRHPLRHLRSTHPGHDHISDEQVDWARMFRADSERLFPMAC